MSATAQRVICGACGALLNVVRSGGSVSTRIAPAPAPSASRIRTSTRLVEQPEPADRGPEAAPTTDGHSEQESEPVPASPPPSALSTPYDSAEASPAPVQLPRQIEPHPLLGPDPARHDTPLYRRLLALAGGIVGVALAATGEWLVESGDKGQLSLVLYLAGIAIFAASAWLMRPTANDLPAAPNAGEEKPRKRRIGSWSILVGGTLLAILLNIIAALMIRDQLDSIPGIYLWLASVVLLGLTGIAAGSALGWSPRWRGGILAEGRGGRLLLIAAVLVILVVASAARLIALDKIPFGINADEGDRASTSIQILRDANTASIFDNGWYFISNVYFWLMAQLMKLIGVGFAQARAFGALASIISVAAVTWIGIRHFSVRIGLLAGVLLSLLGLSLQFARETSEAGPTAMLWAVSVAFLLEAARTGKAWAWIGAGLAGGFSLYFYPSARLWAVLAAAFVAYLLLNGLGSRRLEILRGAILAAVAALVIASPFLVHTLPIFSPSGGLDIFTIRAQETSIFNGDNPSRLSYYDPSWNSLQLLAAQVNRSVGMFNQYHDEGGFWPTDLPAMWGLLAVLTLLGIGWVSTRWRDPRYVLLALWFWIGLAGVIVTVETPNVQRFAAAVPALAFFPALVLDSLASRVEGLFGQGSRLRLRMSWAAGAAAVAVALFIAWTQYDFYFNVYGNSDRWPQPTIQGDSVNDQGTNTLVVSIAREFHQVNSGWVRLLAPFTPRGGDRNPGLDLPLSEPADKNLAFMLYPAQTVYIPYLSTIYPGGATIPYTATSEGLVVDIYKVPKDNWSATQGAMAYVGQNRPVRVSALGEVPPGVSDYPATIRWTAGLRVPTYWNYQFRVRGGTADLKIDGVQVLTSTASGGAQATVSLAMGMHYVEYQATAQGAGQSPTLEWAVQPVANDDESGLSEPSWASPATEDLYAAMPGPQGLLGVLQASDGDTQLPAQQRLDGTLAFCCPTDLTSLGGRPFTVNWTGTLAAPASGVYSMTMFTQGALDLKIDGQTVMHSDGKADTTLEASPNLTAGPHSLQISLDAKNGPGGLEWAWTPPGDVHSIVPPSALTPPQHAGIGAEVPHDQLGQFDKQLAAGQPLETVP